MADPAEPEPCCVQQRRPRPSLDGGAARALRFARNAPLAASHPLQSGSQFSPCHSHVSSLPRARVCPSVLRALAGFSTSNR